MANVITVPGLWDESGNYIGKLITVGVDALVIGEVQKPVFVGSPISVITVQVKDKTLGTLFLAVTLSQYRNLVSNAAGGSDDPTLQVVLNNGNILTGDPEIKIEDSVSLTIKGPAQTVYKQSEDQVFWQVDANNKMSLEHPSGSTPSYNLLVGGEYMLRTISDATYARNAVVDNTPFTGSPEGVIAAPVGSFRVSDAGVLYFKQTGSSNTGWMKVTLEAA